MSETVIVHSTARGEGVRFYHTQEDCPAVQQMSEPKRRAIENVPDRAEPCQFCGDAVGGNNEPDWEPQRILREAEPGDLITDGGTATAESTLATPDPDPDISDDDPAQKRALAVVVWVIQGEWDRVEDGCWSLIATARKRRGESQ